MVSSYASYNRLLLRGGAAVGGQSLQNILDYAEDVAISPATLEDDACCIECVIDSEREEAFFAMVLTTKRLLSLLDSSKPLETDETFKVMHEGYALTLIGQSDMNRVWHLRLAMQYSVTIKSSCKRLPSNSIYLNRAIGVATNSTQEVGEIYLRAIKKHVPDFHPIAYLGDAAEAFANAAVAVFRSIIMRLMCFAHVYKAYTLTAVL